MKKILLLLLSVSSLLAQTSVQKGSGNVISNGSLVVGSGTSITAANGGVIAATSIPGLAINTTAPLAGGGALSGNLTLSIPKATSLVNGYLSAADWATFNSKQAAGNYITALTGDGSASGPGSVVFTLATVNSSPGTFAGLTINGKGLITAATALTTLAGYGITDGVNATVNDTNVTGSVSGHILTLGWSGTLAAGRLNANVVQGVTNDTNVTGSITAQNLTFGWTGTLAAGRLNANVVQGVTNDTNVTGSIAAQNLTLSWSGQLSVGRGGTGASTLTGVLLGNGASAFTSASLSNLTLSGGTLGISATYSGQSSITTVGTLTSGAIGAGFTAIPNSALASSSITIGNTTISLGGAATSITGLTSVAGLSTITGGAGNLTILAGTGNSRTMSLQTTTSGGVATTFLTGNADQSAVFPGTIDAVSGGSGYTLGTSGGIYAAKKIISASAVLDGPSAALNGVNSISSDNGTSLTIRSALAGATMVFGAYTDGRLLIQPGSNITSGGEFVDITPENQTTQTENRYGVRVFMKNSSPGNNWANGAILGELYTAPTNTQNYTHRQHGLYGYVHHEGSGTMSWAMGVYLPVGTYTSAAIIDLAESARAVITSAGTINTAIGYRVQAFSASAPGTIGTIYSAYFEDQTAGTVAVNGSANWQIYTVGSAPSYFGGQVQTGTSFLKSAAIGTTLTDGFILENPEAATSGNAKISPSLRLSGSAWKTAATAASQTTDWIIYNNPVQGTSSASTRLTFSYRIAGGGYTTPLLIDSNGPQISMFANISIGGDVTPQAHNSYDLGTSGTRWRQLFVQGAVNFAGILTDSNSTEATTAGAGAIVASNGGIYAGKKIITASTFTSAAGVTWDLGAANVVSPTSPNRTLTVSVGGTTYYVAAKTTND